MYRSHAAVLALACGLVSAGGATPAAAGSYKVLHAFQGGSDGSWPLASVIDVGGTLYGTTFQGGGASTCHGPHGVVYGCGTVFSLNLTTGAENVVYSFQGGSDGRGPSAGLIKLGDKLYGTTLLGGGSATCIWRGQRHGCGAVFSVNPTTGAERVVYSFQGGSDGAFPMASLIDVGRTLYGTTYAGGTPGYGTIFSLNPTTGAETVVHAFRNSDDGAYPQASLIDVGGTLYGTTARGGPSGDGTVFLQNPATGVETVVYPFRGGSDAEYPEASLIDVGGILYGTTFQGGASGCGTVFSLNPTSAAEQVVYAFPSPSACSFPNASLVRAGRLLYGTTDYGGLYGSGTVFSLAPTTGAVSTVYSIPGGSGGAYPFASLIDVGGTLYGTTWRGGSYNRDHDGNGTVFGVTP
jgi:uncharacterized repeat protein (TIGR03803 family)